MTSAGSCLGALAPWQWHSHGPPANLTHTGSTQLSSSRTAACKRVSHQLSRNVVSMQWPMRACTASGTRGGGGGAGPFPGQHAWACFAELYTRGQSCWQCSSRAWEHQRQSAAPMGKPVSAGTAPYDDPTGIGQAVPVGTSPLRFPGSSQSAVLPKTGRQKGGHRHAGHHMHHAIILRRASRQCHAGARQLPLSRLDGAMQGRA